MLEKNYTKCEERDFFTQLGYGMKDIAFDIRDWFIWLFEDFLGRLKCLWKRVRLSDSWQLAGILIFVGFFCFLYTLITEGGTIPLSGDFELQGMTFIYNGYDDWHYFFETGVFPLWDTSGILGVSNIAANSFYYLFDPFFLVLLIFPRSFLSQAQSIVTISKLVLAGIFFYHYLKSFNLKISTRKVGALAYAFCGWGWFYAWFFHFAEVMTFFPLMLWGVERCLQKKDPRLLVLSILLMGATNYQFLAIFGVLSFIYAMFRYFQTIGNRTVKGNFSALGVGFIGFAIGLLLTGFIVVPNYLSVQSMPRLTSASYLTNLLGADTIGDKLSMMFTWDTTLTYRANYPFISLIFMNVKCFTPTLYYTTGYDNSGCSLYIFGPLLLLLIPSFIDAVKNKKISQIIAVILLVISVETPFIYYAAGAFSNAYGRWELFVTTSMITFVCVHLDNVKKFKGWYFDVSALIVAFAFYYFQKTALADADAYSTLKTLYEEETWIIPGEGIYLILVYLFLRFRFKRPHFRRDILYIIGVEAIIMGNVTVAGHGTYSYENSLFGGHDSMVEQTNIVSELSENDDSFYRIFNSQATRSSSNLAMVEGYNGVGVFSSVYNYESEELLKYWSRISYNNSWSFGVHLKRNNLDELLGIKYYLLGKDDINVPYGCVDVSDLENYSSELKDYLYSDDNPDGKFKLYLNTNFIDTAFAFDSYMSSNLMRNFESIKDPFPFNGNSNTSLSVGIENKNEINYLKRAIIDKDYLSENSELFENFNKEYSSAYISKTSAESMLANETLYSANWDTKVQGGAYRTLDPDMTDAEYNEIHHDELVELAKQEDSDVYYSTNYEMYKYSTNENNFFVSQGDSESKSGNFGEGPDSLLYGLKYYSKVVFDDESFAGVPTPIAAPDASSRGGAYVSISSKFGYNVDFYLYGYDVDTQTYHVITHDQHMQNNFGKTNDWKYARGFYVDEPVYKIVGLVKETMGSEEKVFVDGLYYEYNDEHQEDVDALKADAINVTYRDANTLDYTSNYDKEKIVVLNVPYDEGWSLQESYTDDNDIIVESEKEYFKVDGGLIGYIAPKGETSYHMSYYTPGLKTGLVITDVGLTFSAAIIGIFYSLNYSKKLEARIRKVYSLKEL